MHSKIRTVYRLKNGGHENKENREYTDFIETWLKQWVGYAEESVFEVNMLVINNGTSIL